MVVSMMKMIVPAPYKDLYYWLHNDKPPARFFVYYGGRGAGKSQAIASSILLRGQTEPIRVLCGREYQASIEESVKALFVELIHDYHLPGWDITRDYIRHECGTSIFFKGLHQNPDDTLRGFQDVNVFWGEEAHSFTKATLDVLIPTIRAINSILIFSYNPMTEDDPIARRFVTHPSPGDASRSIVKHTTWRDLAKAGVLNPTIEQEEKAARGTPEYAHIWDGLPYANTTNQIVSWSDLDAASKRKPNTDGGYAFGVDIARYGNDRTALAIVHGRHLESVISWTHTNLMDTADRIKAYADIKHPVAIKIDDTGVGGGVTDRLTQLGMPVQPVNFASAAKRNSQYPNKASEMWFDFASQCDTISINPGIDCLPELMQELSTRSWSIDSRNKRRVQSKQDYKTIAGMGSPDLADSVLLAYYQPPVMPKWDDVSVV